MTLLTYNTERKIKMKKILICVLAASISGCAATGSTTRTMIYPVIDTAMSPKDRNYYQDINDCNQYVQGISTAGSGATSALAGGAFGAALGAVIGAALGVNPATTAAIGAGSAGISAGAQGTVSAVNNKHAIVAKCMTGRGYNVLQP
jgi:hypothetical protein